MTKIFCDIADIKIIRKFNKKKIVKGFTTNPTLMRKVGAKDYSDYTKKILKTTIKPVSCEVFADDINNMIIQGKKISKWGKNVFVKVPVTNSRGQFMGKVIHNLNKSKIKLNITAVYTSKQTKEILKKINKKTKVIISIFAGRMGDSGKDPIPQFKESIISKIPSARLGDPDDIANAVHFLASNQSNYINGETLHVNGGMYMA